MNNEKQQQAREKLDSLRSTLGASAALFYRLQVHSGNGRLYIGSAIALGEPFVVETILSFCGRPYRAIGNHIELSMALNQLGPIQEDELSTHFRTQTWSKAGIRSSLAALIARNNHIIGMLAVVRGNATPYTREDCALESRVFEECVDSLIEATEFSSPIQHPANYIVAGEKVLGHTHQSPNAQVREWLNALPKSVDRGVMDGVFFDRSRFTPTAPEYSTLDMIRVAPGQPWAVHPVMTLPKALKQAALAVVTSDDTLPTIARRLGKSVETLRNQLKDCYLRLGVGSRHELKDRCRQLAQDQ